MSDGANIKIKVGVTGGAEGAAQIAPLVKSIDSLEKECLAAKEALKKAEIGTEQFILASKRLETSHAALAAATGQVTKAGVQMGTGWGNVGYQVQDVAVQIGAGTSAARALGQQLPQLLSGFGPLGVLLGTVSAVAIPLGGALFNMASGAEAAGEKSDAAAAKLKKLGDARLEKQIAASAKDFKAYLQGLDDEWEKLNRNNEAVQRSIDLIQAEHRAKAEVQSAQAALDLAEIDASDKTDAEKIQDRAKVNRRVEREKFDAAKVEARFRVNAAGNAARGATQEAGAKEDEAENVRQKLADQEAEAAALRGKVNAADQAKDSLDLVEERARKAREELLGAERTGEFGSTSARYSPTQIAALKKKAEAADAELKRVSLNAGGASDEDRNRLRVLEGRKNDEGVTEGGDIRASQKSIEELTAAAKVLAEAADKARKNAEATEKIEMAGLAGKSEASKRNLTRLDTTADSETRKAVKKTAADFISDQAKDDRKDAASDRKTGRRDIDDREEKLDTSARERGLAIRGKGNRTGNKTLQDVGAALADGTSEAELQKLGDQVREAKNKNGAAITNLLLQVIDGFNAQAKEIETLKRRMKNQ